jgi:hypothetical protein
MGTLCQQGPGVGGGAVGGGGGRNKGFGTREHQQCQRPYLVGLQEKVGEQRPPSCNQMT